MVCASDFDKTGFCDNCLNVGCGDVFNSATILSYVSSERTCCTYCHFFINKELD